MSSCDLLRIGCSGAVYSAFSAGSALNDFLRCDIGLLIIPVASVRAFIRASAGLRSLIFSAEMKAHRYFHCAMISMGLNEIVIEENSCYAKHIRCFIRSCIKSSAQFVSYK